MRTLTTNRFLSKTLRTLCCVGALTACSAWATVVTWQLNPVGVGDTLGAIKDSQSGYTATARGSNNAPSTDASHQYSFRSAPESTGASETSSTLAAALPNKMLASETSNTRPDDSLLFASSNAPARLATELDDAMAKTFNEEFVSVPTVQFASTAAASTNIAAVSMASGPDPMPVPEMSALFPIVGLIAAVSCTQILRRRRAAQQSASRSVG